MGGFTSSLSQLVETADPQFKNRRDWYDLLTADLDRAGLTNSVSGALHSMMTPQGVLASRSTALGDRFLRFIAAPE